MDKMAKKLTHQNDLVKSVTRVSRSVATIRLKVQVSRNYKHKLNLFSK